MKEVSENSKELANLDTELNELIGQFKF